MPQVEEAAKVLNKGGIVIFPTETVYGIGCLLNHLKTIERLYKVKNRDPNKPTLVLVPDKQTAAVWVSFNKQSEALAERFWPGPLTICLPVVRAVSEQVLGPQRTLAIRVSSHTFIQKLLPLLDGPLLAPSANLQGEPAPDSYSKIDKNIISLVDYVVDIEPGGNQPSTIVSFAQGKYNLIRAGAIDQAKIEQALIPD